MESRGFLPFIYSYIILLFSFFLIPLKVIRDVVKKVTEIQNAALGEHKIRDLNDEINKLLREKGHWEDRVKQLGGADYKKIAPKIIDAEGAELPGISSEFS
jgi:hypothetical protein